MKHLQRTILVSLLLLIFRNGYGQDFSKNLIHLPNIINNYKKQSAKIKKQKDSLSNIHFARNWDTVHFNPYRSTKVSFPFKINFLDTTYASPIPRKHVVTSRYGWRRGRAHRGIDIDLITGGHTHTFLDKPEIVKNKNGKNVIINQVGTRGVYVGRIDFDFKNFDINKSTSLLEV